MKTNKPFIFATDIDGTLIKRDRTIPLSNIEDLKELNKNENFILVLITGRSYAEVKEIVAQLPKELKDYYIVAGNGSYVYEVIDNKKVKDIKVFPIKNPQKIWKPYFNLHTNWGSISTKHHSFSFTNTPEHFHEELILEKLVKDDILKFNGAIRSDFKKTPDYRILKELQDKKEINMYIHTYNKPFIEITSYEASKLKALLELKKLLDIKMDQVIVAGDSTNDIEMLNHFSNSFLMRNSNVWDQVNQDTVKLLECNNDGNYIKEIFNLLKKNNL